jgi:hypothetical protein
VAARRRRRAGPATVIAPAPAPTAERRAHWQSLAYTAAVRGGGGARIAS